MKTQKAPDRKKRFSIFLLVLCLVGYAVFAATRYSGYSTYVPFTGQIFRLKAGEVESVRITNGSTGVTCNYAEGEEGFSDLLDTLNSLRYWAWIPDPPVARGGYEYVLWIQTGGESVGFQFTSRSILVRGIWYQVRGPQLGRLAELVDK